MAQKTGLQLLNEVEERIGYRKTESIEGDISNETQKLLNLLNRVILILQNATEWPLLIKEAEIITIPEYITGTVSVTNGVATVTGSTAPDTPTVWDQTFIGRAFQVAGSQYIYRVVSVESVSGLTLNRIYIDTTQADVEYTIAQDRYSLKDDFDRPIEDWRNFLAPYNVYLATHKDFEMIRRRESASLRTGEPEMFTLDGLDDREIARVVRFHPWPKSQRMITYRYLRNHPTIEADTDRILFPARQENVIIETMIDLGYRDFEDDERMMRTVQDRLTETNKALTQELTQPPRTIRIDGRYRRRERARWRSRGAGTDYGDYFDIVGFRPRGN